MKTIIKLLFALLLIAAACVAAVCYTRAAHAKEATVKEARISEIREMVRLCSLEIMDDVALKDSVNGKWLFARCRLEGRVSFDLEKLEFGSRGDTTVVILPPEIVDVRESTSSGSYEVLDTWDNTFLGLGNLSAAEENTLRRRQARRYRSLIYSRGYVRRARATAVSTLEGLFRLFPDPVVVTDPYPEGAVFLSSPFKATQ